jgi:hypothetical protein
LGEEYEVDVGVYFEWSQDRNGTPAANEAAQRLIESFLRGLGAVTNPDHEPAPWE